MTDLLHERAAVPVERDIHGREELPELIGPLRRGIPVVLGLGQLDEKDVEPVVEYAAGLVAGLGGTLTRAGATLHLDPHAAPGEQGSEEWRVFAGEIADRVFERIVTNAGRTGDRVLALGESPDVIAGHLVASLPLADPWDQRIGPFYDTPGLRQRLHLSRQALHARTVSRTILAVRTGDRTMLYPAFQFGKDATPLPHLAEILKLMDPDDLDPWGDALWLSTPADVLGGLRPAEALRRGRRDEVAAIAGRIGAAWTA